MRISDDLRTRRLPEGQALSDECSCGHPRKLHQDEYADAHLVGWGPCVGLTGTFWEGTANACHCRAGDYPRTAEDIGNMRDEGTWGA